MPRVLSFAPEMELTGGAVCSLSSLIELEFLFLWLRENFIKTKLNKTANPEIRLWQESSKGESLNRVSLFEFVFF